MSDQSAPRPNISSILRRSRPMVDSPTYLLLSGKITEAQHELYWQERERTIMADEPWIGGWRVRETLEKLEATRP